APAGLAAAGIEPALLPPAQALAQVETGELQPELPYAPEQQYAEQYEPDHAQRDHHQQQQHQQQQQAQQQQQNPQHSHPADPSDPGAAGELPEDWQQEGPGSHESPWFAAPQVPDEAYESAYNPTYVEGLEPTPVMVPTGPGGRTRPLGSVGTIGAVPGPRTAQHQEQDQEQPQQDQEDNGQLQLQEQPQEPEPDPAEWAQEDAEFASIAYEVFAAFVNQHNDYPSVDALDIHVTDGHNVRHPRSAALIRRMMPEFKNRYHAELEADHIA
ncbi:hypothetical protein ACFXJ6_40490, partial [Streptomyces sp. NPDC059218]